MIIGIVLNPYDEENPAGLGRIILEWTRALIARDTENEYVVFLKRPPRTPLEFSGTRWQAFVLGGGALWLERVRFPPRAGIYPFNTPAMPLSWCPPRAIVIALDFAYRHLPAYGFRQRVFRILLSWYHGYSLRHAGHVVSISEATKCDVITFHNIAAEKISVIYPGFVSICEVQKVKVALPEKFFLFVGVLKQRKNVLNTVRAFIRFCERNDGYHLVVVGKGDGGYADGVRRIATESAVSSRIHFLGFISDAELAYVYSRAAVFLFPSFIEGFGFPVLEAMDCGTPVVTSRTFSLPEVGGNAALIVNPHDIDEIAHAMHTLANDVHMRERCITRGRIHIKNFSWEKSVQKITHIAASLYGNQ